MAESLKARSAETFLHIPKLINVLGLVYGVQCGTTTFSCIDDAIQRVEPSFNFIDYLLHCLFPYMITGLLFVLVLVLLLKCQGLCK